MKNENELPQPSYTERTVAVQKTEVAGAEAAKLNSIFEQMGLAAQSVMKGSIDGANLMREAGLLLQSWCGHKTMSFHFWKTNCENKVAFNFETAKIFMSVARRMERKAKTLNEAFEFTQLLLIAEDLLQLPERTGAQTPNAIPPVQKWFNDFTEFRQRLNKIKTERPMEEWEPPALEKLIGECQWLIDAVTIAKQLLAAKQ